MRVFTRPALLLHPSLGPGQALPLPGGHAPQAAWTSRHPPSNPRLCSLSHLAESPQELLPESCLLRNSGWFGSHTCLLVVAPWKKLNSEGRGLCQGLCQGLVFRRGVVPVSDLLTPAVCLAPGLTTPRSVILIQQPSQTLRPLGDCSLKPPSLVVWALALNGNPG